MWWPGQRSLVRVVGHVVIIHCDVWVSSPRWTTGITVGVCLAIQDG